MKKSNDPVWLEWIKLFNYYCFSPDPLRVRQKLLQVVALDRSEREKACAVLALSVAKWHPLNPNCGSGICFCCEYYSCKTGEDCPAMEVCGPKMSLDDRLYHKWFTNEDREESRKLAAKIYWVMLREYRKALKEVENMKQVKRILKRHFGKRITHAEVEEIPEGLEFLFEEKLEDPKDEDSDSVLRCTVFDDKGRQHLLGDFGGVKNIFRLDPIPPHLRMQVYIMIARAADKIGAA
jgi:hypothetical protein